MTVLQMRRMIDALDTCAQDRAGDTNASIKFVDEGALENGKPFFIYIKHQNDQPPGVVIEVSGFTVHQGMELVRFFSPRTHMIFLVSAVTSIMVAVLMEMG